VLRRKKCPIVKERLRLLLIERSLAQYWLKQPFVKLEVKLAIGESLVRFWPRNPRRHQPKGRKLDMTEEVRAIRRPGAERECISDGLGLRSRTTI
jgi:hypothetical protein